MSASEQHLHELARACTYTARDRQSEKTAKYLPAEAAFTGQLFFAYSSNEVVCYEDVEGILQVLEMQGLIVRIGHLYEDDGRDQEWALTEAGVLAVTDFLLRHESRVSL